LTVFFKGDVVERVESDPLPSEAEFVATLKSPSLPGSIPSLEASEESLKKYPLPKSGVIPPAPTIAPTDFPPLEGGRP
jgi:outer membrane protein assembly factor BamE